MYLPPDFSLWSSPEFTELVQSDRRQWSRWLLWHRWLPALSGLGFGSSWAGALWEVASSKLETVGTYSTCDRFESVVGLMFPLLILMFGLMVVKVERRYLRSVHLVLSFFCLVVGSVVVYQEVGVTT